MNRARHLVRIAAGVGALVLAGAGVAAATTPPTEPPADTAGATDTAMVADTAAADTAMVATSEPMAGGGPSSCPAAGAEATAMVDDTAADDTAMVEDTAAADTAMVDDTAADTAMVDDTAAADTAMGTEPATTGGPFVQIAEDAEYGPILVDSQCRSLYIFGADSEGEPTCVEDCAINWPPLFVEGDTVPPLADELDPSLFSIVEHAEGPMLKVGDWPLYYFAGDAVPGDTNGQGVGGNWWLVTPDGTPIEEAAEGTAPAGTEPAGTEMAGTEPAGTEAMTDTAPATTTG